MSNKQNTDAPMHLIIENPLNGKFVNILPLLQLADSAVFSGFNGGSNSLYGTIDLTIRRLATIFIEDEFYEEIRNTIDSLYELRDAFENTVELSENKRGLHAKQ